MAGLHVVQPDRGRHCRCLGSGCRGHGGRTRGVHRARWKCGSSFFSGKTQGFDHQQMRDLNIFSPENEGIYLDKTTCRILGIWKGLNIVEPVENDRCGLFLIHHEQTCFFQKHRDFCRGREGLPWKRWDFHDLRLCIPSDSTRHWYHWCNFGDAKWFYMGLTQMKPGNWKQFWTLDATKQIGGF